jgi:hypothetical protein
MIKLMAFQRKRREREKSKKKIGNGRYINNNLIYLGGL